MTSETRLNLHDPGNVTLQGLLDSIEDSEDGFILEVPCPSIGTANSHLSIAFDYLDALYVGESVAEFCREASFFTAWDTYRMAVCFVLHPSDAERLAEKILWLVPGFDGDLDWGDESYEDVRLSIAEFEDSLEERTLRFPELADDYFANYIGGEYDLDEEDVEKELRAHPERRYHVWRSCASKNVGYDFFVSPWIWIVPHGPDITSLLRYYGGFDEGVPSLGLAEYLATGQSPSIVYNQLSVVQYPQESIDRAQECAREIWPDSRGGSVSEVLLSEGGDVLVASDPLARYVLFADSLQKLSDEDVERYLNNLEDSAEGLRRIIGKPAEISCRWDDLTDERFEELCYDILLEIERYDPAIIKKMGKARSRDGGRDIEIMSRGRAGKAPVKWVIQCKLIKKGGSLAGGQMQVSDTIDQYGAGRFCVMTSGIIDSTLHDRLAGISDNRRIEVDSWSRLELERFLAQKPQIRVRYFPRI
jgi:hypothetical protein